MNWSKHVRTMRPHVVRITTPDGAGTGFILHIDKSKGKLTLATAAHVVRDALSWNQLISIYHEAFKEDPLKAWPGERSILLHPRFDSACITVDLPEVREDAFPQEPIEHVPFETAVTSGTEVGWLGFPYLVNSKRPSFFSGHISVFAENRYFIDGVAIPGVSGGPAFRYYSSQKKIRILGSISSYRPNRARGEALPGLMVADDCTQWPDIFQI